MCAWRYNAAGAGSGLASVNAGLLSGNAQLPDTLLGQGGASAASLSGAGAFLRQNAAGMADSQQGVSSSLAAASAALATAMQPSANARYGGQGAHDDAHHDEESFVDEEEEEEQDGEVADEAPQATSPAQLPARSLASAFMQQVTPAAAARAQAQQVSATKKTFATPLGLSRQLFRPDGRQTVAGQAGAPLYYNNTDLTNGAEEEDEEGLEGLSEENRAFVHNTRELFSEVDPQLLSTNFVPHEHVLGIIASETTGEEATPQEIEEQLQPYVDLKDDIDYELSNYVEANHAEFNTAIADFSEMVLAVSGSDDTVAQLKRQLTEAVLSLENHAAQLRTLRLRAAKSLFTAQALSQVQRALGIAADVRGLLARRHYLAAVQLLRQERDVLAAPEVRAVRATQGLREGVEASLATVHGQIIDDLIDCVFRQGRLYEADARLVGQLMAENADGAAAHASAPGVQQIVQKYWSRTGPKLGGDGATHAASAEPRRVHESYESSARMSEAGPSSSSGKEDGADKDGSAATEVLRGRVEGGRKGAPSASPRTLADIVASFVDDPADATLAQDYLRFIPLCVKSLQLLDKLDHLHEAFFARSTKNLERFIGHFLQLYDTWRRRALRETALVGSDGSATVYATRVRAVELVDEITSVEEAIATLQARELQAMLTALFTELEKIMRNANYLHNILFVLHFPFVAELIVRPEPFDAAATSARWSIADVVIRPQDAAAWRELLVTSAESAMTALLSTVQEAKASNAAALATAVARLREMLDWDGFFAAAQASSQPPQQNTASSPVGAALSAADAPAASYRGEMRLYDVLHHIDDTVARLTRRYDDTDGGALRTVRDKAARAMAAAARARLVDEVRAFQQEWDLQALWAQLNYHVEFVFHVVCDARDVEEGAWDDMVTLAPFLRQKNLVSRVQRTVAILRGGAERQGDEGTTLDKLLTTYESTGLLRLIEETGPISFSLAGAVRKAQSDIHRSNEGQARQFYEIESDAARLQARAEAGGGGGAGVGSAPLIVLRSSALRTWFVFTPMNALACYACASRFVRRCADRVPDLQRVLGGARGASGRQKVAAPPGGATSTRTSDGDDADDARSSNSVLGFFRRFLRSTYIPHLQTFHVQHLQQLFLDMGDFSEQVPPEQQQQQQHSRQTTTSSDVGQDGVGSALASPKLNGAAPSRTASATSSGTAATTTTAAAPASPTSPASAATNATGGVAASWPTLAVPDTDLPILACVVYAARVMEKIAQLRRVLPPALAEDVEQSTSESLLTELALFLKRKVQLLGRGTIQYRLLNNAFEDAFACTWNRRWAMLCDEAGLSQAHQLIDRDLYLYYQYHSAQRTSGHEYNRDSALILEAQVALEKDKEDKLDERIGIIPAAELGLHEDSSVVALAVLCTSAEWLCGAVVRYLWPSYATGTTTVTAAADDDDDDDEDAPAMRGSAEGVVPGHCFRRQIGFFARSGHAAPRRAGKTETTSSSTPLSGRSMLLPLSSSDAGPAHDAAGEEEVGGGRSGAALQRRMRLVGHLCRLVSLSQVALFYLSIEARFVAFQYLPQLRDESYNVVAVSSSADTFVQAYARHMNKLYNLLSHYLSAARIKYTCLTAGKPASELVLLELAHLRDKAISDAGLHRLRTDLLVLQTTLQLLLPTDVDLREAVSGYFARPAVFIRYIPNTDVVNDLIASGDYRRFSQGEIEVLIRLVFRQIEGANEDAMARANIALFARKRRAMEQLPVDGDGSTKKKKESSNGSGNKAVTEKNNVSPQQQQQQQKQPSSSATAAQAVNEGDQTSVAATTASEEEDEAHSAAAQESVFASVTERAALDGSGAPIDFSHLGERTGPARHGGVSARRMVADAGAQRAAKVDNKAESQTATTTATTTAAAEEEDDEEGTAEKAVVAEEDEEGEYEYEYEEVTEEAEEAKAAGEAEGHSRDGGGSEEEGEYEYEEIEEEVEEEEDGERQPSISITRQ